MRPSTATTAGSRKGKVFSPSGWFLSRQSSSSVSGNETRNPLSVWKNGEQVDTTDEEMSERHNRMKEIDLAGLLYFVDDPFFVQNQIEVVYSPDRVYKLTSNNINIGFAVNLTAIFDGNNSGFAGFLFEDPESGYFALVVHSSNEDEKTKQPHTLSH